MSPLPTDALPAAEFIIRHMQRMVETSDSVRLSAIPETADPLDGDVWFWTDDNAKVLELLSRPEVWRRFPTQTAGIIEFLRAMCDGPFIFRRLSIPRLDRVSAAEYRHSLMTFRCDLGHGAVAAGMRFHDGAEQRFNIDCDRQFENVLFVGNRVEFTYRRKRFSLDVEPALSDCDAAQDGDVVTLRHSSELYFTPKRQPLRLGRITYVYRIDARSMLFEVEAALELEAVEVSDVVLTIAHDRLGPLLYGTIDADTRPSDAPLFEAGTPGRESIALAGASYYVIRHKPSSGDSLALHTVPREPARLSAIEAAVEVPGRVERAVARYSFPGMHRGARLVAGEYKLLTGGGFYDRVGDYARFMRDAVSANDNRALAQDYSISYDYGVVINAFAKCFAAAGMVPGLPAADRLRAELRALVDRYLGYYLEIAVAGSGSGKITLNSRELSFAVLAAVTMCKATGAAEYRERLIRLCEALLGFEMQYPDHDGKPASGFLSGILSGFVTHAVAHVDCQSAALLALVQAAPLLRDPRLFAAIDRGLRAFCLLTALPWGVPHRVDTVGTVLVDAAIGTRLSEPAFWNFKAGLTLRMFAGLRGSPEPKLRQIAARHRDRIDLFELILRRQIGRATRYQDDAVEFRCSDFSTETNSETQPWVMLGLVGHPAD